MAFQNYPKWRIRLRTNLTTWDVFYCGEQQGFFEVGSTFAVWHTWTRVDGTEMRTPSTSTRRMLLRRALGTQVASKLKIVLE